MIKQNIKLFFDQQKLKNFCHRQRIDLVILHGSYATGYATRESDIDIGVLTQGHFEKKKYWRMISDLMEILGDKCDVVRLNEVETMITYETAMNGIPLYEREEGLFDDFVATTISRYQDAVKFRKLEKEYIKTHIQRWRRHD